MKPSPMQWNQLKTCPRGDFDMLKWNLRSKTFQSFTQTSKWRKTTSRILFFLIFLRISLFFLLFPRVSWIPGSEPIHLDLEKLFLLSDSMENLSFYRKNEISEPEKKIEKINFSFFGPYFPIFPFFAIQWPGSGTWRWRDINTSCRSVVP